MTDDYIATFRLLLDLEPTVFQSSLFALKGGTALTFVPIGHEAGSSIGAQATADAKNGVATPAS